MRVKSLRSVAMQLRDVCNRVNYIPLLRSVVPKCRSVFSGRIKRMPTRWITNEFAFSFEPNGWNYFRALIAEYEQNPKLNLRKSTFARFFQHERVRSIRYLNDVLFLHMPAKRNEGFKFYFGTFPWGDHVSGGPWGQYFDQVSGRATRDLYGYRRNVWYEPGDPYPIEIEWKKTVALYHSIKAGYRPFIARELPEVTLLIRRDGQIRAVRYNGQHRLSVLSHLGYERITVLIPTVRSISEELGTWPTASSLPKVIHESEIVVRESEVEDWPYVRQGLCSRDQALEIFHAFFELNGRERISYLGLPPVY